MKRAAIYARYSTDLQDDRSIADQVAICRDYAERAGCVVVQVFDDRAISGASIVNRPGVRRLIDAARARQFDVVIAETMSRIGRSVRDRAVVRDDFKFAEIVMMTPVDGIVSNFLDGIKSAMDENYIDDLRRMTWRGQAGNIAGKLAAGGKAYGYALVKGEPGRRVIVEAEAEIVRRIFAQFVAGDSPRAIAHALNREGIAAPRGKSWNASTLNGNGPRGIGILRNALYAGRLEWNKVRMIKDPDTGKRISRPNPRSEWKIVAVPELAILTLETFTAAHARKEKLAHVYPGQQRRPKRLLSGLLRCAACGSGMALNGGTSKSPRVRCSKATESGVCSVPGTFTLPPIEAAVIGALMRELKEPAVMTDFVRAYHDERRRLASEDSSARDRLERRLGECRREIARLVDAIAKGHGDPAVLGPRSAELDAESREIEGRLAAEATKVIELHPGLLQSYEGQLASLKAAIERGQIDAEGMAAVRELVEGVKIGRGQDGRTEIAITGRLNALLGHSAYPNGLKTACEAMVAGTRYVRYPRAILFTLRAAA